jgi:hypothetical protein
MTLRRKSFSGLITLSLETRRSEPEAETAAASTLTCLEPINSRWGGRLS